MILAAFSSRLSNLYPCELRTWWPVDNLEER